MAPRTDKPRLHLIDPKAFAEETIRLIVDHLAASAVALSPGIEVHITGLNELRASTLYNEILDLCRWAQRGEGDPTHAHDLCLSVATACWPSPLYDSGREPRELYDEADPATAPGLLIVAAFARERIHRGEPVSPRDLAALASVDQAHVRLRIREGEIGATKNEAGDLEITALAARRWLAEREVSGFVRSRGRVSR